jgi:hypothetical protein
MTQPTRGISPLSPTYTPGACVASAFYGKISQAILGYVISVHPREIDLGAPGLRGNNFYSYRVLWSNPPTDADYWSIYTLHRESDLCPSPDPLGFNL